ncbi:hypothetical protein [Frankia sp. CiP3]|uniref:hypothetical protein n=1 Tax=Frankia sp. CiP3 TaxID=2880971 RepID=UPI001EF4807E|nr:hypothetical protein [Frankia sp. CiP3]
MRSTDTKAARREAFFADIREAHRRAGSKSYRTLAERTGVASGTIGNLLNAIGQPRWSTVERFVKECRAVDAVAHIDMKAWKAHYDEAFGQEAGFPPGRSLDESELRALAARLITALGGTRTLRERLIHTRVAEFLDEAAAWDGGEIVLRRENSIEQLADCYARSADIRAVTVPGLVSVWDTQMGQQLEAACARPGCHTSRIFRYASAEEALAKNEVMRRQHNLGIEVHVFINTEMPRVRPGIETRNATIDDFAIIDGETISESLYDTLGNPIGDRWHLQNRPAVRRYAAYIDELLRYALPYTEYATRCRP